MPDSYKNIVRNDLRTQAFANLLQVLFQTIERTGIDPKRVIAIVEERVKSKATEIQSGKPWLVGIAEIAAWNKIAPAIVIDWINNRSDFPQPIARLKCGLVFKRSDVDAWIETHKSTKVAQGG